MYKFSVQNGLSRGKQVRATRSPMPLCQGIKADRQLCGKNATRRVTDTHPADLHLCGTHKNSYNRTVEMNTAHVHYTPGDCFHTVNGWGGAPLRRITSWCPHAAVDGAPYCVAHEARRQQWIAGHAAVVVPGGPAVNMLDVARTLLEGLLAVDPVLTWQEAVDILIAAPQIPMAILRRAGIRYFRHPRTRQAEGPHLRHETLQRFDIYWIWAAGGRQGPAPNVHVPPPAPQVLGRLARDTQNVHTQFVAAQTNTATEKLMAVKVPETQQTEKQLAVVWLGALDVSYGRYLPVAIDMNRWFNTKDCRTPNDNLYRKLLRGIVATVGGEKDDERKSELYRRLWEECSEAVGMCCEGHISRLCNVLVGFDEAFQPPVPFGEILQSKMSAIASLDASEEEKRRQATAFFDEHGTPAEDRVAWLEAF